MKNIQCTVEGPYKYMLNKFARDKKELFVLINKRGIDIELFSSKHIQVPRTVLNQGCQDQLDRHDLSPHWAYSLVGDTFACHTRAYLNQCPNPREGYKRYSRAEVGSD